MPLDVDFGPLGNNAQLIQTIDNMNINLKKSQSDEFLTSARYRLMVRQREPLAVRWLGGETEHTEREFALLRDIKSEDSTPGYSTRFDRQTA